MKVIGCALRKNSKKLETHFVFASHYYFREDTFRSFILDGMKKYKIKPVMVTIIDMWRSRLITKEAMDNICKRQVSVNDDLESLIEDIRLGKQPLEFCRTYFFPKLTKEELKAVARKDPSYLETLSHPFNKAVDEAEMKLSESDSKLVQALGSRKTFTLNNPSQCSLQ